jgi:hypothetical protein
MSVFDYSAPMIEETEDDTRSSPHSSPIQRVALAPESLEDLFVAYQAWWVLDTQESDLAEIQATLPVKNTTDQIDEGFLLKVKKTIARYFSFITVFLTSSYHLVHPIHHSCKFVMPWWMRCLFFFHPLWIFFFFFGWHWWYRLSSGDDIDQESITKKNPL